MKTNNYKFRLHPRLVKAILKHVNDMNLRIDDRSYRIEGYTRLTTVPENGNRIIYYANPHILGRMWYDWAYVHFDELNATGESIESYYPAKILGFITIHNNTEAIVQCSQKQLNWTELCDKFMVKRIIGTDIERSFVSVPISALVHPLCVFPDYGGDRKSYLIVLPKRNWSRYFGDRIEQEYVTNIG